MLLVARGSRGTRSLEEASGLDEAVAWSETGQDGSGRKTIPQSMTPAQEPRGDRLTQLDAWMGSELHGHFVPFSTLRVHFVPFSTLRVHFVPFSTLRVRAKATEEIRVGRD
jgi:hypothetical protein